MVVAESWFRHLWRPPRKHHQVIGVLAFEVASLMSKLVHLFQCLTDKHIFSLRDDLFNSTGIRKLVSQNPDFIEPLVYAEIIDNMSHVARAVARLGARCSDPGLKSFKHLFNDFITLGFDPNAWESSWKKMDRRTKKMERFISINANLYQEIEILRELEQNFRRIKATHNDTTEGAVSLIDFEKKLFRKRHEVRNLQDMSLWNKTYDYTVRLLVKSLFTLFARITHVFGITQAIDIGFNKDSSMLMNSDFNTHRNPSLSTLMQSSVFPPDNSCNTATRFSSGPLVKSISKFSPMSRTLKSNNFYSGPLGTTKSASISVTNRAVSFFSGPLGKPKTKPTSETTKPIQRLWQRRDKSNGVQKKNLPMKGHLSRHNSPVNGVHYEIERSSDNNNRDEVGESERRVVNDIFSPKRRFLDAPADTLGGAALALHYANVIIVIEKLVASPHLIGDDARDDLYNMLPGSVRSSLKEKLKPYAKSLDYDTGLAGEWSEAMCGILEWLAPLAHNMIRWQSERSFEQHNFVSRTNVLLVQTLYFANQEKTEAIITELLVGLNYVWRLGREVNAKALLECGSSKMFDKYVEMEG